jgi:hypothetical protein
MSLNNALRAAKALRTALMGTMPPKGTMRFRLWQREVQSVNAVIESLVDRLNAQRVPATAEVQS